MASPTTNQTTTAPDSLKPGASSNGNGNGHVAVARGGVVSERLLSRHGRLDVLTGVQILGCGSYTPEQVVHNDDLGELGYDADWILQRTGIHERRRAAADEATSDLAYKAARCCLDRAGMGPEDIDLILVATVTPDNSMPSTACHLQRKLGASAPAMDINAACAGFVYALVTGMSFIKSGCSQRALVVGADLMTRVVNPADKKTFPLFGDGAGAVLLGASQADQGLMAYTLGADGEGADLLVVPAGGTREPISHSAIASERHFLQMDGRAVFKWAVRLLAETIEHVLSRAGQTSDDVDLLVFHQANARIIDAVANELGVDRDKLVMNLDRYGNTSAASIPLALDEAHQQGRIERGDKILLCGFGAGLAWGAGLLKW